MTFPDDENPLNSGQQPPEQPEEQPESIPVAPPSAELVSPDEQVVPPFPAEEDAVPEFDFPRMEEDVAAFHRELDELQFAPAMRPTDDEPVRAGAPRHRRRTQRIIERPDASELAERLESIAYRAAPTFDFFVFSFLCGCILGLGYILDAPAILLIGILVAPIVSPWVGAALAASTGEVRFFGQTFGGFLTALFMVFFVGLLAGLGSRIFQPLTSSQAFLHSRLWWPDLLLLVIGTVILVIAFIQTEHKPALASLMVAYELYLPVSATGFGLGSGVQGLWPEAGLVFLIHLALSLVVSLIVFFYMGFRPLEAKGYILTAGIVMASLIIVAGFAGLGSLINVRGDRGAATPIVMVNTPTPKPAPILKSTPTATIIQTPTPTHLVITPTAIFTPTEGFTPSPTLLPTPVYGRILSKGDGATIRTIPGGAAITTVQNGYLVEILGDAPIVLGGNTWVHVIVKTPSRDIDGWMLLNLITTATPSGSP
jgi:hypothetical protein